MSSVPTADPLSTPTSDVRPAQTARRAGYGLAAGVNGVLLYLINVAPGWEVVPFLTEDTEQVLGLLNASLAVALVINLLWILADPPWWRALGQIVQSALGLAVALSLLDVFPFDVTVSQMDIAWLVRFVLVIIALVTAIGLLVQVATLGRILLRGSRDVT